MRNKKEVSFRKKIVEQFERVIKASICSLSLCISIFLNSSYASFFYSLIFKAKFLAERAFTYLFICPDVPSYQIH